MNLLLYGPEKEENSEELLRIILRLLPNGSLEIHYTLESLSHRLHEPRKQLTVAVLNLVRSDDLNRLVEARELLADYRLILVLPDNEAATISKAHHLRPRFLTTPEVGVHHVEAVLGKMISSIENPCGCYG